MKWKWHYGTWCKIYSRDESGVQPDSLWLKSIRPNKTKRGRKNQQNGGSFAVSSRPMAMALHSDMASSLSGK